MIKVYKKCKCSRKPLNSPEWLQDLRRPSKMVVSFRVFKKTSPNGRLTLYLGRRDFIDHVTESDPVDGVLLIDKDYLQGKQVRFVFRVVFD